MSRSSVTRLRSALSRRSSSDCDLGCTSLRGLAVALNPGIQAVLTDIEPDSYFRYAVTTLCYLLHSFNLEFFEKSCLLVHEHLFYLWKLRPSGVYKIRGDSV